MTTCHFNRKREEKLKFHFTKSAVTALRLHQATQAAAVIFRRLKKKLECNPFFSFNVFIEHYPSNEAINLDKDKLHLLLLKKICPHNLKSESQFKLCPSVKFLSITTVYEIATKC